MYLRSPGMQANLPDFKSPTGRQSSDEMSYTLPRLHMSRSWTARQGRCADESNGFQNNYCTSNYKDQSDIHTALVYRKVATSCKVLKWYVQIFYYHVSCVQLRNLRLFNTKSYLVLTPSGHSSDGARRWRDNATLRWPCVVPIFVNAN